MHVVQVSAPAGVQQVWGECGFAQLVWETSPRDPHASEPSVFQNGLACICGGNSEVVIWLTRSDNLLLVMYMIRSLY